MNQSIREAVKWLWMLLVVVVLFERGFLAVILGNDNKAFVPSTLDIDNVRMHVCLEMNGTKVLCMYPGRQAAVSCLPIPWPILNIKS